MKNIKMDEKSKDARALLENVLKMPVLKCKHCDHKWMPRRPQKPKVCPICKRTTWEKGPKKKKK